MNIEDIKRRYEASGSLDIACKQVICALEDPSESSSIDLLLAAANYKVAAEKFQKALGAIKHVE